MKAICLSGILCVIFFLISSQNAITQGLTVTGTIDANNLTITGTIQGGTYSGTFKNAIIPVAALSATGTPNTTTYLRGDNTWATIAGGGTVTTVSVVTANGISGSVATATTTPAITLSLGAITPTSVNASGGITGTTLGGTITTPAQTNITSLGILSGLIVNGTVSINNSTNAGVDINTGTSTGTINLGGTGVQTINIGTGGTGAKTINLGTGAIANTITIGNTTAGTITGINVAAPTAILHLGAGKVTANQGAPLKFSPGTNLTTPENGAFEFDGNVPYFSPSSGRGAIPTYQFVANSADFTLSAAAGVQTVFAAGNDVITVAGNTTYFFEGQYILNTGGTSHTTAMAFALGGGASVTSFEYTTGLWSAAANTVTTTQSSVHVSGVASKVLNAASTAVYTIIRFQGVARINAGGTISPQINFSANPTGTNLTKVGSYLRFIPIGSGSVNFVGPWN